MAILESNKTCETNISHSEDFSFSSNASKLFLMLSDYLYSDKEYCVISELASNAVDAHTMVGKQDVPIYVDLPTTIEPQLTIRDYGPGLSEDDVYRLLTKYGESTKQHSQDFIGAWGIGSKSPAAVTDNWTIKSHYNGIMKHYEVFITSEGIPTLTKIFESKTAESGLEVIVPVSQKNINIWKNAAEKAFKWYKIKPECNVELTYANTVYSSQTNNYNIHKYRHDFSKIVTTLREYNLNIDIIREHLDSKYHDLIREVTFTLFFEIGEIDLSISREQIQYTEKTIKNICAKIIKLVSETEKKFNKKVTEKDNEVIFKIQASEFLESFPSGFKSYLFNKFIIGRFNIRTIRDLDYIVSKKLNCDCIYIVKNGKKYRHNSKRSRLVEEINIQYDYYKNNYELKVGISNRNNVVVVLRNNIKTIFTEKLNLEDNKIYIVIEELSNPFEHNVITCVNGKDLPKTKKLVKTKRKKYIKNLYKLEGRKFNKVEVDFRPTAKDVLIPVKYTNASSNVESNSNRFAIKTLRTYGYRIFFTIKDSPLEDNLNMLTEKEALTAIHSKMVESQTWKDYIKNNIALTQLNSVKIDTWKVLFVENYCKNKNKLNETVKNIIGDKLDDLNDFYLKNRKSLHYYNYGETNEIRTIKELEKEIGFDKNYDKVKNIEKMFNILQKRYPLLKYFHGYGFDDFIDYFNIVDSIQSKN